MLTKATIKPGVHVYCPEKGSLSANMRGVAKSYAAVFSINKAIHGLCVRKPFAFHSPDLVFKFIINVIFLTTLFFCDLKKLDTMGQKFCAKSSF